MRLGTNVTTSGWPVTREESCAVSKEAMPLRLPADHWRLCDCVALTARFWSSVIALSGLQHRDCS